MRKLLIIEDDQLVANVYRSKFDQQGYQVEVALDGEAGLAAIRSFRPDAVVLDLMLPKMTGIDLMLKVRAEEEFAKLPIIVFSNTYLTHIVQAAWKAGATKCLSKANCSAKQIIEVVNNALAANGGQADTRAGRTGAAAAPGAAGRSAALAPETSSPAPTDAEFQADLRRSFIESLPGTLAALRTQLQGIVKAENEGARLKQFQEMYRRIHALTGNGGLAGLLLIAQMSDALEALLKELIETPKSINVSTLRTVALTIDFIGVLFEKGLQPEHQELPPGNVLVVDDEAISRRAVTFALDKAKLKSVAIEDPQAAYDRLLEKKFDLIFLDVDMPNMSGFELCAKLRSLPAHKRTPVVFVTSLNSFESRANSTMSGGNDFIAKPFLFIELAVKALMYVLRAQLETAT